MFFVCKIGRFLLMNIHCYLWSKAGLCAFSSFICNIDNRSTPAVPRCGRFLFTYARAVKSKRRDVWNSGRTPFVRVVESTGFSRDTDNSAEFPDKSHGRIDNHM